MMKNSLLLVVIILACSSQGLATIEEPSFHDVENDQPPSPTAVKFFQLKAQSHGQCLALTSANGIYLPCSNHDSTVYYLIGDKANYHNIVHFGTGQCLDREHCHSSTSNLRLSSCNHCGAKHWDIRSDGSVREDNGKNCIYSMKPTSVPEAAVQHCKDGFEKFTMVPIGNHFRLKSIEHGDCVGNGKFVNCNFAPTYYYAGTSLRNYYLRLFSESSDANLCLDREKCHHSTSNIRFSECSHCGAKHWSIENTKVGEDDMKNCINRESTNVAAMKHCSIGHEELQPVFIPTETFAVMPQVETTTLTRHFRDPNIDKYLDLNLEQNCRGVRIFEGIDDSTVEVEVVHFLPSDQTFSSGQYTIQYMVTNIHTNIPFEGNHSCELTLKSFSSHVTAINIRYGGVGGPDSSRNFHDGLFSEFLTNTGPGAGLPVPLQQYPRIVSQIYKGFSLATDNWYQYYDTLYQQHHSPQIFISLSRAYYIELYWSRPLKETEVCDQNCAGDEQ